MLALARKLENWPVAERAARMKLDQMPSARATLDLAKILYRKTEFQEALRLLADVGRWHGRIEDQVEGWLLRCDSLHALGNLDEAERCLHRLDAEGLIAAEKHHDLTKRLEDLARERMPTNALLERWNWRLGLEPLTKPDSGSGSGSGSAAPH
jgi:hypothetical protein